MSWAKKKGPAAVLTEKKLEKKNILNNLIKMKTNIHFYKIIILYSTSCTIEDNLVRKLHTNLDKVKIFTLNYTLSL